MRLESLPQFGAGRHEQGGKALKLSNFTGPCRCSRSWEVEPNDIAITEQRTLVFSCFIGRLRSTLKSEWPLPGTIRIHHEPVFSS